MLDLYMLFGMLVSIMLYVAHSAQSLRLCEPHYVFFLNIQPQIQNAVSETLSPHRKLSPCGDDEADWQLGRKHVGEKGSQQSRGGFRPMRGYISCTAAPDIVAAISATTMNHSEIMASFRKRWPVQQWESVGLLTEDFLLRINVHWKEFDPPDPMSHYALAMVYTVMTTLGVIGNCLVICMYTRRRSLRTQANILIMNLAVSDLLMILKTPIFIYNSLHQGPALGQIGCSIYGFIGGLSGTVSIMTLAAIAADRYHVIVHPLVRNPRQNIYLTVLALWLYGAIFATLPLLDIGFSYYTPEGYLTSCSFDYLTSEVRGQVMIFVFFLAAWLLPLSVIIVCYTGICRAVMLVREMTLSNESCKHCKQAEKRKTEIKVAGVVITIIGLWFVSWTPYAIVALLGITGQNAFLTPFASMVPALFCKAASCIDPYVYAVTHPRFRLELRSLVRGVSNRRRSFANRQRATRQTHRRSSVEEMDVSTVREADDVFTISVSDQDQGRTIGAINDWKDEELRKSAWCRAHNCDCHFNRRATSLCMKPDKPPIIRDQITV